MKSEDLIFKELIRIEDGNINLRGRRLEIHPIHAFGQFRRDIIKMLGGESARRILTRFGYFWGRTDAAVLKRVFKWSDKAELIKAAFRMQALSGAAIATLRKFEYDEESSKLLVECKWQDSSEVDAYLTEFGPSDEPICWRLNGYVSGFISSCLERDFYFVEENCQAKGDSYCLGIGKDLDSWGSDIESHLEYFESEDIKGYVKELTEELEKKSKELARSKKILGTAESDMIPYLTEGRSKIFKNILEMSRSVARFDTSVLITGETGVGKEVLARFIHAVSPRAEKNFVAINCGALPETLLESELFGYKAGSFTGAVKDRIGLFEQSDKGTIFLDEIGDISPAMQLKILRAIQEKEIIRIGENTPRKVEVRIISATNKDLEQEVSKGNFRQDLLFRLKVVEIHVPPLRDRREDILPLARSIMDKIAERLGISDLSLDSSTLNYLLDYSWPGNIRELENALERAAVFSRDGIIFPEGLPANIFQSPYIRSSVADPLTRTLDDVEKDHIVAVLRATGGNKARAAKTLGICTATLWRKLKQIGET